MCFVLFCFGLLWHVKICVPVLLFVALDEYFVCWFPVGRSLRWSGFCYIYVLSVLYDYPWLFRWVMMVSF